MNDPADSSIVGPNTGALTVLASDSPEPVVKIPSSSAAVPALAPHPLDKDPLAVLEELLAKQKAKGAGGGGGGADGAGSAAASKPVDDDLARRRAEYEQLQADAAARDQQLLALQEQKMMEIRNMPQYKARVSQNQEKLDDREVHTQDMAGFQIMQLNTKKVFVPQQTDTTPAVLSTVTPSTSAVPATVPAAPASVASSTS